jgi:protein-tyrosine-phosphatase
MKGEGIDISHHRSVPLTRDLIEEADLILVMDRCHRQTVLGISPGASQKTVLLKEFSPDPGEEALNISDPLGGSLRTYEKAFREIKRCLEELLKKVDYYLSTLTGREEHG